MPNDQSYKSHARFDPPFHFFVLPALIVNLIFAGIATYRHWPQHHHLFLWWVVMSIVLFVMAFKIRTYALHVQNRLIRLEERLRLTTLMPEGDHAVIYGLTEAQMIALRFASDAEVPALARRAAAEKLTPKQIKESVTSWRADQYRV